MQDNRLDEILGTAVPNWTAPSWPKGVPLKGRYAQLERLDARHHAAALFEAYKDADQVWDYMPYGPYARMQDYQDWVDVVSRADDPLFYAIYNCESAAWEGVASYLRVKPESGSIEVGHINFSPALQQTRASTEAMFLMMQWAFQAGYRRYEWKCNARNLASRRAAQRLGFSYEGVFRQATVIKGYNRDTAWFAVVDHEWEALSAAFQRWLSPDNFEGGEQIARLSELTGPIRVADDPAL